MTANDAPVLVTFKVEHLIHMGEFESLRVTGGAELTVSYEDDMESVRADLEHIVGSIINPTLEEARLQTADENSYVHYWQKEQD